MDDYVPYDALKLRKLLDHQGRRRDWLATETDYSNAYISRVLGGDVVMSEKFAQRAAKALGVPLDLLVIDDPLACEPVESAAS